MSLAQRPRDDVTDVTPHPLGHHRARARARARRHPMATEEPLLLPPPEALGWRYLWADPAHFMALGFGSGLAPAAPGTMGSLCAWFLWAMLAPWATFWGQAALLVVAFPVAWWASTITAEHLDLADPGAIVADEIIAMWLILWLIMPASFFMQLLAFGLFRLFDALKPGPVGWADRRFHDARGWVGGLGIMLDDLVAAVCALAILMPLKWLLH